MLLALFILLRSSPVVFSHSESYREIDPFQEDSTVEPQMGALETMASMLQGSHRLELHQLDTFYNALNINDQDSLNSAAGGNFLDKMPRECYCPSIALRQEDQALLLLQLLHSVKAVEISCVTLLLKPQYPIGGVDKGLKCTLLVSQSTTPVQLGMDECLALADLGASINLMPFSVWEKLSLPDLTPTCMTLELADRSISKPMGIAKDISVKVGVFHFPADFVVVDFEPDPRVPLILGRCFLKTSRALIDVHKGELTLRIGSEAITYNLDQTSRYSANYTHMAANKIDVIDMA
ncbi:reverse transcriptase domain-containing protein [Tanacetum coccineum]